MDAFPGSAGPLEFEPMELPNWGVGEGELQICLHRETNQFRLTLVDDESQAANESEIDSEVRKILARGTMQRKRLSGPIQFVAKLLEFWRLDETDVVALLGFGPAEKTHVADVFDGLDDFRGRDVKDRIAHLFRIRETLDSLFRNLDVENQWLREPHSSLDGKSPLSLLLGGSMEDILLTRDYVDAAAGR